MRIAITILFFLFVGQSLWSVSKQDLISSFNGIYSQQSDNEKIEQSRAFKSLLKDYLNENNALEADLVGLRMFSEKESKDRFRIFNWNIPLEDDNFYECLFAVPNSNDVINIIECKPTRKADEKVVNRIMSNKDWPAALYYDIIPMTKGKCKQFILLGWDGKDEITNQKVIEILTLGEKNLKFGANKFKEVNKPIKRFVLEYGEEASVSINYDEKFNRFVFDHLSPTRPDLEGQFQFYVPDMTFDAFVLKKGELYLRENIKFLREKTDKDANFYDPRQ